MNGEVLGGELLGWFGDLAALQLRIAVVIGLAWVATRALHRRSSAIEHRTWTLAVAAIVMLPVATMVLPAFVLAASSGAVDPIAPAPAIASADVGTGEPAWSFGTRGQPEDDVPVGWGAWIVAAWALGAAALLGQVLVRLVGARILVRGSVEPDAALVARIAVLAPHAHVRIRIAPGLASPVVLGLVRPVVLLPADASTWPCERLRPVIVHELAHVAHGDHRWFVVAAVARALAWIDPFAWWMVARLRRVAELAADDAVVSAGIDPHDYARELVLVARASGGGRTPALAPSILTRLPERIAALLLRGRPRSRVPGSVGVPLALGTLGVVASLAAVHMLDESRTVVRLGEDANDVPARTFAERIGEVKPEGDVVRLRNGRIELRDPAGAPLAGVSLDGMAVPTEHLQGHLIVPLKDLFSGPRIIVDADEAVPWSTIVDVLYTAGRSGVREYVFTWRDRSLRLSPPTFYQDPSQAPADQRDAERVRLTIDREKLAGTMSFALGSERVALHSGDGCSLAPRIQGDAADTAAEAQSTVARRLCEIAGGHYMLSLSPAPSIAYGEITRTLERLVDVPGCRVDVVVESGEEAPIACAPDARALDSFE